MEDTRKHEGEGLWGQSSCKKRRRCWHKKIRGCLALAILLASLTGSPAFAAPPTKVVVRTFALAKNQQAPKSITQDGSKLFLQSSRDVSPQDANKKELEQTGDPLELELGSKNNFATLKKAFPQSYKATVDGFDFIMRLVDVRCKTMKGMKEVGVSRVRVSQHEKSTTDALAEEVVEQMPDGKKVVLYLQEVAWEPIEGESKKGDFSEPLGLWQAEAQYSGTWSDICDNYQLAHPVYQGEATLPADKRVVEVTYVAKAGPAAKISQIAANATSKPWTPIANALSQVVPGQDEAQERSALDRLLPAALVTIAAGNVAGVGFLAYKKFDLARVFSRLRVR